jgi:hypothetical protein
VPSVASTPLPAQLRSSGRLIRQLAARQGAAR